MIAFLSNSIEITVIAFASGLLAVFPFLPASLVTHPEQIMVTIGFGGQGLFAMRFIVQWLTSEGQGRSVIPIAFWYFSIGTVNLVLPFFFISFGMVKVQSNLGAILMSTAPIYATILGQLFIQDEKINPSKLLGVLIGFLGIVYLFSDDILINQSNFLYALIIILGPFCYTLGGLFTLRLKHVKNETLTSSCLVWGVMVLLPFLFILENPTEMRPALIPTISLIYLGIVATAIAWLLRFYLLKHNGLVFQSQVAYIIPIFGLIFGYLFLGEQITYKIIVALIAVMISTYLIERGKSAKIAKSAS